LLLALILPLFAIVPLLIHAGLPNTADGPAHLMRQVELNQAWQEGNFYPRWGPDLAFGHGMPIFSYAPPALYQLTQFFHLFGLPLDEAMKAVLIFDFLLYSLGMFLFARRLFGPCPALLAAALYVYAPYRLREAYIQGNYGQFTGLAFYPLILWAFHGLITTGRVRYLVAAAFSLAGLLFSHNISFMLFAPILVAYLLFLLALTVDEAKKRGGEEAKSSEAGEQPQGEASHGSRGAGGKASSIPHPRAKPPLGISFILHPSSLILSLGRVAAAGCLGLGLAAIFWLPAFGERHEIQLEGITQGFFDFRENFISLPEFFSPPLPLDLAAINPKFPLSWGLPQIIGAGIGLVTLLVLITRATKQRVIASRGSLSSFTESVHPSSLILHAKRSSFAHALFFTIFLFLYAFLSLPQSQAIWEAVPLLELAEFPWRMLGPAIFCTSLLAAFPFSISDFRFSIFKEQSITSNPTFPSSYLISHFFLLFSIFCIIALNAYYLYPSQFIVWGTPTPTDAFAYEVTSGAIGTTSTGEFLPYSARQHPQPDTLWPDYAAGRPPQKIDPATLPLGAAIKTVDHRSESDEFLLHTPQEFTATIRTLYWPGWQVYLNGRPTAFTITEPTDLIQTVIPAGQHTLTLRLKSTPLRTAGLSLTILSFTILVIVVIFALHNRRTSKSVNQRSPVTGQRSPPSPIPPQFFTLATTLLVVAYFLSRPLAPFFTLQSDPNRPQPADQIFQVDFGHNADQTPLLRLVGMDKLPSAIQVTPSAEAELTATLYWRALPELKTNYSVFLHLDAPNGQTLATVDELHPENIPTRNWPPGLYLRNLLHLKIPANIPPILYEVNVGLYDHESGERLVVIPSEATTFNLGSIWLMPPPPRLPQTPLAHFGQHITLWQSDFPSTDQALVLYWQTDQPLDQNYTVFVHLLDAGGNLLAQADGVPYAGLYPLTNWQPGQIITDSRPIASLLPNAADLDTIAIGLYDPITGERLPATDAMGQALPNNSFVMPVTP